MSGRGWWGRERERGRGGEDGRGREEGVVRMGEGERKGW